MNSYTFAGGLVTSLLQRPARDSTCGERGQRRPGPHSSHNSAHTSELINGESGSIADAAPASALLDSFSSIAAPVVRFVTRTIFNDFLRLL